MKVLGIDPATAKPLGYGLVSLEEDRFSLLGSGLCAYEELPSILAARNPDLVVIEDQYMFKNYNTAKKLAWSAGIVMGICKVFGFSYDVMNVAHWKKVMGAQKTDKKDKTAHIRRCKEFYGEDFHDDVASAILIATAYLTEHKGCGIME